MNSAAMNSAISAAFSTLPAWADIAITLLVLTGTAFSLIGSWGLAKLGDFYTRLHGPSKATTLGVGCVLMASALWFSIASGVPNLHGLLIALFLFLTAPVSAHMLLKAALHVGSNAERQQVPTEPRMPAVPPKPPTTPSSQP